MHSYSRHATLPALIMITYFRFISIYKFRIHAQKIGIFVNMVAIAHPIVYWEHTNVSIAYHPILVNIAMKRVRLYVDFYI